MTGHGLQIDKSLQSFFENKYCTGADSEKIFVRFIGFILKVFVKAVTNKANFAVVLIFQFMVPSET